MVGDVIALVVIHLFAVQGVGSLMKRRFGQVDRPACLALRVERSVALGGSLGDFVFDRKEIHIILSGIHIRVDDDAFLVVFRACHAYRVGFRAVAYFVAEGDGHAVFEQVVGVMYDLGYIVSLQLEYHLQVIAEVVPAQAESEGFVRLYVSAGEPSDEAYFGPVVDTYRRLAFR